MRPGRLDKFVSLSKAPQTTPDSDGFFEDLAPRDAWVSIEPLEPFSSDGTRVQPSRVTMRYHPQVTLDVRILYGTRELFVKGVQNVNENNSEMRLYCEEAIP